MRKIPDDKLVELLHWLAYNFPGVYRQWSDKKNQDQLMENMTKILKR